MQFLVIAAAADSLDMATIGDAPSRSNRYRDELSDTGKLIMHAHVAGHRAHVWIFDVADVDELDRVISDDPMSRFFTATPQIYPLTSATRMQERAQRLANGPANSPPTR